MKKLVYLLMLVVVCVPISLYAQDDMYFVPKKSDKGAVGTTKKVGGDTLSKVKPLDMSVDEYNRRHMQSSYNILGADSLGNDIIEFEAGDGKYPEIDTIKVYQPPLDDDDFYYSAQMGLFDGYYGWYNPYFYGYMGGRWGYYYDMWYPWYHPWAYGLYDPWYNGWYYGYYLGPLGYYGYWYDNPAYWGWGMYPYFGWGHPNYYVNYGYTVRDVAGTRGHAGKSPASLGARNQGYTTAQHGTFGGNRIRNNSFGGSLAGSSSSSRGTYASSNNQRSGFGGARTGNSTKSSSSRRYVSTPSNSWRSASSNSSSSSWSSSSSSSSSMSSSGGSFGGGGSRSGGGFSGGGGGRSGGGGGFGGRR